MAGKGEAAGVWGNREGTSIETADVTGLVDPLSAGADAATGDAYVLLDGKLQVVTASGEASEVAVKTQGIEGFFTPSSGSRCPMLAVGGRLLLVDKESLIVIDSKTGETRVIKDSKWCLGANDGETVYLADKGGAVHRAEHALSHASFPGSFTLVHDFKGQHKELDINDLYKNDDFLKSCRGETTMRLRDSGSALAALWAGSQGLLACKGHGLLSAELPGGGSVKEILKEERSADTFAFPSALYAVGSTVFAQCVDGVRKVPISGGPVSLVLKAGEMVFDDDSGSPEPYPKDVIGCDSKYIYFMVERDFYSGMALRRWPHGCKGLAKSSASEADGTKARRLL